MKLFLASFLFQTCMTNKDHIRFISSNYTPYSLSVSWVIMIGFSLNGSTIVAFFFLCLLFTSTYFYSSLFLTFLIFTCWHLCLCLPFDKKISKSLMSAQNIGLVALYSFLQDNNYHSIFQGVMHQQDQRIYSSTKYNVAKRERQGEGGREKSIKKVNKRSFAQNF